MKKGSRHTPEARVKMCAVWTPERRAKKRAWWTLERREKFAAAQRGESNPAKQPKARAKLAAAAQGHRVSLETRTKIATAMMGSNNPMKRSEVKAKHFAAMQSPQVKAKHLAATPRGDNHPMKRPEIASKFVGDKNPMRRPEVAAKNAAAQRGRKRLNTTGDKHPMWRGGISREPYGWEWSPELREAVRQRDGHRCQLCGISQAECGRKLDVHHIDYDKQDNDPAKLITLCKPCHSKTNTNRDYWQAVFSNMPLVVAM